VLLEHLTLANFRNYAALEFTPRPGLNLLIGENAQGKSNLLEAIAMLGTGKSFRTPRESEVIRSGQALASVAGIARVAAGTLNLACTIAASANGTRKQYTINGESVRYAAFLGSVKVVTFVPADLALVSGGPGLRRAMLNEALSVADRRYYRELARYRKALTQKNALLRGAVAADPELLAIYDATLVRSGSAIALARRHYVAALGEVATSVHGHWIAGERLELRYVPNVPIETPTEDAVAAAFTARLEEQRTAESVRKMALVGPHRDELAFLLDGEPLGRYGSQGQGRSAVLALKFAEYAVLRDRTSEAPILLLDDVLSELDQARGTAFVAGLGGVEQAFITATHHPEAVRSGASVWKVVAARVSAC
jgi:DNA replication and repair protein RecF